MNTHIGRWRGYTAPDSPGNVPSCCSFWEKGGRTNGLPRLPAWRPSFRPAGGHLCHVISWVLYQQRRDEDLYYQVYKLRRLPGSLPSRPDQVGELTKDVVSSLKNCLRRKDDELPRGWGESKFADTQLT